MRITAKRTPIPTPPPGLLINIRFELADPMEDGTPVCRIAVQRPDGTWIPPVHLIPGERVECTVHLP